MALTMAHHDGRVAFGWDDLVEALTTLDAGTAVGTEHVGIERRSVAIHEAGHAVAGHLYVKGAESARLTIKKRGETGGHHWMIQKEDRMFAFQHEMFADVVHTLGAMAAERVFYGENTSGVGGDVQSVTWRTARMVGGAAMGPQPFTVTPKEGQTEEQARDEVLRRFERIGLQIMSRSGGGPFDPDPISGVLSDPSKRTVAAQILGQALRDGPQRREDEPGRDRPHRRRARGAPRDHGRRAHRAARHRPASRFPSSTWPTRRRGRRPSSRPPSGGVARSSVRARPRSRRRRERRNRTQREAARVHRRRAGAAGRPEQRVEQQRGRRGRCRHAFRQGPPLGLPLAIRRRLRRSRARRRARRRGARRLARCGTTRPAGQGPTAAQFTPSQAGELGAADAGQRASSGSTGWRTAHELAGVVASRNTLQDGQRWLPTAFAIQVVQPFDATGDPDTKFVTAGSCDPVQPLRLGAPRARFRGTASRRASGCSSDRGSSSPCARSRTTAASTTSPSS